MGIEIFMMCGSSDSELPKGQAEHKSTRLSKDPCGFMKSDYYDQILDVCLDSCFQVQKGNKGIW